MSPKTMTPTLACIYSLPRSGSTVLIAELDRLKGVICLPESYFPQILELLSPEEKTNRDILAAFFRASSPSGSLLTFEESKKCMVPNNWNKTLINLGLACAEKTKRDPKQITVVIWKTTRIVGKWKLFSEAGGHFIILKRNPINVFESQFRVAFGKHNRNPFRFSAFLESYSAAFSRIPKNKTYFIEYEQIPEQSPALQAWLGVSDARWVGSETSLMKTHAKKTWHKGLLDGFKSHDSDKRKNVKMTHRISLKIGTILVKPLRPILGILRNHYDNGIMGQIRQDADEIIKTQSREQLKE